VLTALRTRGAPPHAQEPLLDDTFKEFKAAFPKLEFRKARRARAWPLAPPGALTCAAHRAPVQVGVNLGTPGAYLKTIEEKTADIDVTLLFNNAGFMVTGFFDKTCAAFAQAQAKRHTLYSCAAAAARVSDPAPAARARARSGRWGRTWPTWSATR
jgi:hypothetical protein